MLAKHGSTELPPRPGTSLRKGAFKDGGKPGLGRKDGILSPDGDHRLRKEKGASCEMSMMEDQKGKGNGYLW